MWGHAQEGSVVLKYWALFKWAHIRFQKFLEILNPMCVSPYNMQPKFLAAQRQGVGAKFSPVWKVGRIDKSTWTCAAEFYMNKSIHCVLLLKISRERPSGELETREARASHAGLQRPNRRSCLAARFRGSGALHERRRRRGAIGAPAAELLGGRQ
jgi:hypothetical protein